MTSTEEERALSFLAFQWTEKSDVSVPGRQGDVDIGGVTLALLCATTTPSLLLLECSKLISALGIFVCALLCAKR